MTGGDCSVSLNEVESLSAKAVRGAGASWGVAEDIARAARWMAARRLDWSGPLLAMLDSAAVAEHVGPVLRVADLLAGARPGDSWRIESAAPIWALAILSNALQGDLNLDWHGPTGLVRLHPWGGVSIEGEATSLDTATPQPIVVTAGALAPALPRAIIADARRSAVPRDRWTALEAYAARTYVPTTAASRAAGAGGERVDAD